MAATVMASAAAAGLPVVQSSGPSFPADSTGTMPAAATKFTSSDWESVPSE